MRRLLQASLITLALAATVARADDASPVGVWKKIDESNGKPIALIRITAYNGVLQGKIEKLFTEPDQDPTPKCEKCVGIAKGQPLLGLMVLWGLKPNGDEYAGGEILIPSSGKVYRSKIHLVDGGKKLSVRRYVGVPLLGSSQVWEREDDDAASGPSATKSK